MDKIDRDRHMETGIAWNVAAAIYERDGDMNVAVQDWLERNNR